MVIVLLSPACSIHTIQWARYLRRAGNVVHVVSQHLPLEDISEGINFHVLPFSGSFGYFVNAYFLRKILNRVKPDILNVHYASGYGTTAALIGYRPTLLSVWGSDVYDFPFHSWLHRCLINWNLRRATCVASTSEVMARQVVKLVPDISPVFVTPFGVDSNRFIPGNIRDLSHITIGTVKTLAPKYGIDILIRAFAILLCDPRVSELIRQKPIRLVLVGGGPDYEELKSLAEDLNINSQIEFVGQVTHDEVPQWLRKFDIYVAVSRSESESFGVAVLEASACGLPVVVSDIGGLPEVVRDEVTGLIVPHDNPTVLADSLVQLLLNSKQREAFGQAGRRHVLEKYEWERCVGTMVSAYRRVIEESSK